MSRYSSALKTTLHLIKRAVQVTAGVSLFKDKVGDLRWCEGGSMLPTLNVTGDLLLQIPISSIFNFRLGGDRTIDNSGKTGASPIEPTNESTELKQRRSSELYVPVESISSSM
ncbi:hypothetical protein PSHT_11955 [Puccinia striiformis]|uniref:Peptidase S26 domain-containing protein n=1 Tax=Puccinia striiformis TaxID=27350 RepID=A0A2S4UZV9_9BASI|nr:hypothetical protein PSHT_11955 [Puccinia striiformis]